MNWDRLRSVFDQAVRRPRAQRDEFITIAAADDPALAAELRALLRNYTTGDDTPAGPDADPPAALGPYRIVREIGRGGMGIVFEATHQATGERAALKLIRRGMDSQAIVSRFRRERAILAQLAHPAITRLQDAGVSETGQPYLVMELVDGLPWNACVPTFEPRERLRLLAEVCQAVDYAHRRLILHRDLKPSNILVTRDHAAKLLDFGAARLLDTDPDATITGARPFTPRYASPEVRAGLPASVAADVYSLGVMLAEIAHPADRDAAAIAAKATREEPGQRYPSAAALGQDLERALASQPVEARQGNWAYVAGRFFRRHRGGVIVGAVAALALLASGVMAFREAQRANAERRRADQSLASLRALSRDFVTQAGAALARDDASRREYQELVARSAPYLRETLVTHYPAALLDSLDRVCHLSGSGAVAISQLCGRLFLDALRRASANQPGSAEWLVGELVPIWYNYSADDDGARWAAHAVQLLPPSAARVALRLDLARFEHRREHWDDYVHHLTAALQEWRRLPASAGGELPRLLHLAQRLVDGDADDEALWLLERLQASLPRRPSARPEERADLYRMLGDQYRWRARGQQALVSYRRGLGVLAGVAGAELSRGELHHFLGVTLEEMGRPAEALPHFRTNWEILEPLAARDGANVDLVNRWGLAQQSVAGALRATGRAREAVPIYRRLVAQGVATWQQRPTESSVVRGATFVLLGALDAYAAAGLRDDALSTGRLALRLLAPFVEPGVASRKHLKAAIEFHQRLAKLEPGGEHPAALVSLERLLAKTVDQQQRDLNARVAPLRPLIAELVER